MKQFPAFSFDIQIYFQAEKIVSGHNGLTMCCGQIYSKQLNL